MRERELVRFGTNYKLGFFTVIELCLNGRWLRVDETDPSMTLLRFLRTNLGQTGTKEGCASGDCGACTVVVYDDTGDVATSTFRSINSCITLAAAVNGKRIFTVEGLRGEGNDQELHPVQAAMVDFHGSQCGFCTPGFVMSLFALFKNHGSVLTEEQVLSAISGNLCRCTGYRPIVDAALHLKNYQESASTLFPELPEEFSSAVKTAVNVGEDFCVFPKSESQLQELLQDVLAASGESFRFVAGGTDLLLEQTQQFKPLEKVIGLSEVQELKTLSLNAEAQTLSVGAAVTLSELEYFCEEYFQEFAKLLHRVGSRQIRNQGTLLGNIANASPIGDTPPFLLALDANLTLCNAHGVQRTLPLADFFVGYKQTQRDEGEYLHSVDFKLPENDVFLKCYKISKRFEDDISAVLLVVRWSVENDQFKNVRISVGGMAAIPKRVFAVEAALEAKPASMATINAAKAAFAQELAPLSDVRASSEYRMTLVENLLAKAWLEYSEPEAAVSVWEPELARVTSQHYASKSTNSKFGGQHA